MIEINLLPQPLRKVKGKKFDLASIQQQPKYLLYFILLTFGVLICLHIYLVLLGMVKNYQLTRLNKKWSSLEPQLKILQEFKTEYQALSADAKIIQKLLSQRLAWAEKLNKLSINLPPGVWLNELSLGSKELTLKGSVISLQKEEMSLLNQFISNLRNDADFFKDFTNFDLSSVQRKTVAGYDTIDFLIKGKLK